MCGIAGLSRAPQSSIPDARRFVLAALIAIEERGYDSTGIAWTQGDQDTIWYDKLVGPATKVAGLLDISGREPIMTAIMHTRWSTQGEHTYDNAHPVVAENVVLVHNGVITNDAELRALATAERVGEVDSWALAAIVQAHAHIGAEHPADVLDLAEGDAAVGWLDSEDTRDLHLARLTGRPMTIGWTKRGDFVMSSTRATLQRTARLADVAISDMIDVPIGTYLRVRAGKIVEWRGIGDAPTRPQPQRRPVIVTEAPRKRRISPHKGITDLIETRPADWWDEAERMLADDEGWPSGIEQIRARPRNDFDW